MTKKTPLALLIAVAAVYLHPVAIAADSNPPVASAAQDLLTCVRVLARDPQYAEISTKLPLQDLNTISFGMLADQSRPTPQERKEIANWFDERDQCWKSNEPAIQTQWPPELFQLSNEANAGIKAIGVELYNGKITYGQANKQIEQLGNSIKARIIPIVKQYQADIATQKEAADAQRAAENRAIQQRADAAELRFAQQQTEAAAQANQAEALRQQRAQLFLNYLRTTQQQPIQVPQLMPSRTTSCQTFGNNTNCITR